jgi:hypothetical protein
VPSIRVEDDDFVMEVSDSGGPWWKYSLGEGNDKVRELIERAFLIELRKRTKLWSLDSPRKLYEPDPFLVEEGIAAYRRYEVGTVLIEGVGVGIGVDVGTAFISERTVAYFFDEKVSSGERERRRREFDRLVGRQSGQKGTLVYDNGRTRTKCYFEGVPVGVMCESTGRIRVRGQTFDSLFQFYRSNYPALPVTEETPVARVSFRGLDRPQFVAADRLRIRVMNDELADALSSVDKIDPCRRREMIVDFWNGLGGAPLGRVAPGVFPDFWRPDANRVKRLKLPELEFGQGARLPEVPAASGVGAYRTHYRQRMEYLDSVGCYYVPPAVSRTIYCAYPRDLVDEEAVAALGGDLPEMISRWMRLECGSRLVSYERVADAVEQLRRLESAGTVVFVLNGEPTAYHDVAFQLPDWRVKRVTATELLRNYKWLKCGSWDRRRRTMSRERGAARWLQFVQMNGLAVLQLLDCVPWRGADLGRFEAHVAIDVGHDRRYMAVSLLIVRDNDKSPSFHVDSIAIPKPDPKHEAINDVLLAEHLVQLFRRARGRRFDPLASVLFLRDGQVYSRETSTLRNKLVECLVAESLINRDARIEVVEFHKKSAKAIRLWDVDERRNVDNPLEGTAVTLCDAVGVVTSTGAATLHQGTTRPFLLVGVNGASISDAAEGSFYSAQLNYSSPGVAQRLPLELKRTDDELVTRAAQEVRRLR